MTQKLVMCAFLGLCFYMKGCGNNDGKCPCDRRLQSVLVEAEESEESEDHPGRILSSRRRRRTEPTNQEYSEFCCSDDSDSGSGPWSSPSPPPPENAEPPTTSETINIPWPLPEGPFYTIENATWSSVSFLEETLDFDSCDGDPSTRDNAWIPLNICMRGGVNLYRDAMSFMFSFQDGALLWTQWTGLGCSGFPNHYEQFPTECTHGTSRAYGYLGPSMAEGPNNVAPGGPPGNIWFGSRTGYLTYAKTPVTMPAWAYGFFYHSEYCSTPEKVWVSPLGACKREPDGSYKMFCENGKVVQHYYEANKTGCSDQEGKCACDPTIPPPDTVGSMDFDGFSTTTCKKWWSNTERLRVLGGCDR